MASYVEQLYQETVDQAISRGDIELLANLYQDSLQYGSFGKKIRKEIDARSYDIADQAFPSLALASKTSWVSGIEK